MSTAKLTVPEPTTARQEFWRGVWASASEDLAHGFKLYGWLGMIAGWEEKCKELGGCISVNGTIDWGIVSLVLVQSGNQAMMSTSLGAWGAVQGASYGAVILAGAATPELPVIGTISGGAVGAVGGGVVGGAVGAFIGDGVASIANEHVLEVYWRKQGWI